MKVCADENLIHRNLDFYFVYEYDKRKLKKYIRKEFNKRKGVRGGIKIGKKSKLYNPCASGLYINVAKIGTGIPYRIYRHISKMVKDDITLPYCNDVVISIILEVDGEVVRFSHHNIKK